VVTATFCASPWLSLVFCLRKDLHEIEPIRSAWDAK